MSRTFTVGVRVRCWSEGRHFEVFAVSPHLQARCAYKGRGRGCEGVEEGRAVQRRGRSVLVSAANVM